MNKKTHLEQSIKRLKQHQSVITRRDLLRLGLAAAAAPLVSSLARAATSSKPIFSGYPYTLGVASGYPSPHGFVLWTRLAPQPFEHDGGMLPQRCEVSYDIADDEHFSNTVISGKVFAVPELAHSVHVDIEGLSPDRWYWYRFRCGDEVSATGRTRTTPSAQQKVNYLKLGVASCQNYEQGYFSAHRHLSYEHLDLMFFLGDYIYEDSWGDNLVRRHLGGEARTLHNYRQRYAQYKADADLQQLHAQVPWVFTWDDHEVDNDYAANQSEFLDPQFALRRAAAYQAYFEHMPLPRHMRPTGSEMRLYQQFDYGNIASFVLLDDRQYRDPQPCPSPEKGGGSRYVDESLCPELKQKQRSLLGKTQEQWLDLKLAQSQSLWNVIAQQTLVAPMDGAVGKEKSWWTDGWDGYPQARQRLLNSITNHRVRNPLILGGDLHASVVAEIPKQPGADKQPSIAAEFCGTSISAQGWPQETYKNHRAENPHLHHIDSASRGYLVCELKPKECKVSIRNLDSEKIRDSKIAETIEFTVEQGSSTIHRS
jgi:alkaline phosphatase D